VAKAKSTLNDDRLIAQHIDPDWARYGGLADARTREGVPVWALVNYLRLNDGDVDDAADAYAVPRAAVEAAQVYHRRHRVEVDARIRLNAAWRRVAALAAGVLG
jgi:uncharacterized protein (DUF433 family)